MKTEILKVKGDWQEVVDDCRATVKKEALGKEPSEKFKRRVVIAEHDPIRDIVFKFKFPAIKYWVAMHFKTHTWRSRTNTQRNDRQNEYDRNKAPQDAPVDFIGDANIQHLIDTSRKRLCWQASKETREQWEDLKQTIHDCGYPEVSDAMVPNCVYRCGCPEMTACPYFKEHGERYYDHLMKQSYGFTGSRDIGQRYDAYNKVFTEDNE